MNETVFVPTAGIAPRIPVLVGKIPDPVALELSMKKQGKRWGNPAGGLLVSTQLGQ